MVTRPGGRPVRATRSPCVSGEATSRWPRSTCAAACSGGGAVDVDALDQRAHRGRRLDGVPPQRAVVAGERRHPAAALRGRRGARPTPAGTGSAASVLRRSWSSSGVVGAGSISARTRSIASWVTRPSCSGATGQAPAERDGARAPVDGLAVVEERVGRGGEDLVGEQGRLGGVDEVEAHLALLHPSPQLDEAVAVERLGEAVVHRLARERVVGHLDRARGRSPGRRRRRGTRRRAGRRSASAGGAAAPSSRRGSAARPGCG